jgi:cell division protease FtsH
MNPNFRNFALWIIIILLVVAVVMLFQNPGQRVPSQDIAFSQLLNEVDQGHVREVTIAGNEITGHFTDNRAFATYAPNDPTLVQSLYKKNVSIMAKPPSENTNWLMTLLVNVLPLIAIIGLWIFLSRRMQGGAGTAMGLGKETVSKLGVLCGTTLLAARRLGESNVVLFECSVHNGRPHLEHEVCSSR